MKQKIMIKAEAVWNNWDQGRQGPLKAKGFDLEDLYVGGKKLGMVMRRRGLLEGLLRDYPSTIS